MISAEDRRAAAAVTTSQAGHRFEIQLGHLCNNRCVFCSSGQLTAMKIARPVPLEPIVEALEQARAAGATHLTFLGGEPTIHKRFLEALTRAVELGFQHIVIFTNGVMFTHPGFIDSVTSLGRFEWRISIQGATEEAHVATTGRAESFRRIVHGLEELQQRGQLVTANMCVNERSYRSLPHYPELVARYGVRQLHVDIVRPESTGERDEAYLRDIMPRYANMAPYYDGMLAGFERTAPDFDINVGNLPYCVLPKWASRIHHGGQETVTKSSDGEGLEDEMNKYEWQRSLRTYLPGCAGCVFRSRCTGIFRAYLEMYGGEEFRPIDRRELAALDTEQRCFVMLTEPLLQPLQEAIGGGMLPGGWRGGPIVSEDRHRRIDWTVHHQSGSVKLHWVPVGTDGQSAMWCRDYELVAEAESGIDPAQLEGLFDWLSEHLAAGLETASELVRADDPVGNALRGALLRRARQRVAALSRRLQEGFAVGGWQLGSLRWLDESRADLPALGNDTDQFIVRFQAGVRDRRSQVGVDFVLPDGASVDRLRPAVAQLVSLLRANRPVLGETAGAAA